MACHDGTNSPCCKGGKGSWTLEKVEDVRSSALGFGLDPAWVSDILAKFGPAALALIVEAMRQGLSMALVIEVVDRFGPELLNFIITLLNQKKMGAVISGDIVVAPGTTVDQNGILIALLEQYLPILIKAYGPQILQLIVQYLPTIINVIVAIINGGLTPTPTPTKTT